LEKSPVDRGPYDNHVAEIPKLGKRCAGLAENAYRPVERATLDVE
jgi:hypothetical protein